MEDAGAPDLNVGEAGISAVSVKLRGLPFKALEQDISVFFEGYNVQRALLKRYPDGRPNGEVSRTPYRHCCQQVQLSQVVAYCRIEQTINNAHSV